jgi:uracil-DNA glycosylase
LAKNAPRIETLKGCCKGGLSLPLAPAYPEAMGIGDHLETRGGWQAAVQALAWQAELGAVDPIGDAPLNRYELVTEAPRKAAAVEPAAVMGAVDPVAVATHMAEAAQSLDDLREAIAAFDHCDLKLAARNLVFADGNPAAHVLVLGEAPGVNEDRAGLPFVGAAGQLLDRMFAAIGMDRTSPDPARAIYITNVLPWRPPENRDPTPDEIAMFRPFALRHIALADPDIIVTMGNIPLRCLFNTQGVTKLRGIWREVLGKPVLPMTHPAYLLRNPEAKREAWADLLSLRKRLNA